MYCTVLYCNVLYLIVETIAAINSLAAKRHAGLSAATSEQVAEGFALELKYTYLR